MRHFRLTLTLLASSEVMLGFSFCFGASHHRCTSPAGMEAWTNRPSGRVRGGARRGGQLAAGSEGDETFQSEAEHIDWLKGKAALPKGFKVGTSKLSFTPEEAPEMGKLDMMMTVIALDEATDAWSALFTTNAFPGSPVVVGRSRRENGEALQAIVVNNKVSNVCARGDGVQASEDLCAKVAELLSLPGGAESVLPCSTGVIGWALPKKEMLEALPKATGSMQALSALPAAQAIMTTDRFPKVRSVELPGGGKIVAFAKGAGMIEPRLATMLVYVLTDVDIDRVNLDLALREAVSESFDCISVDSDESTSDTVVGLASGKVPCEDLIGFKDALKGVCQHLADDLVRNGEGTNHVIEVKVSGAPDLRSAIDLGRAVANSPLVKCAVAGNDPNVGRIVSAIGKYVGTLGPQNLHGGDSFLQSYAREACTISIGGRQIFAKQQFEISAESEAELVEYLRSAELGDGGKLKYPSHKKTVEIEVYLGLGGVEVSVLGSDLTQEYLAVNSDYRS